MNDLSWWKIADRKPWNAFVQWVSAVAMYRLDLAHNDSDRPVNWRWRRMLERSYETWNRRYITR